MVPSKKRFRYEQANVFIRNLRYEQVAFVCALPIALHVPFANAANRPSFKGRLITAKAQDAQPEREVHLWRYGGIV
jgi:hypothetical protein